MRETIRSEVKAKADCLSKIFTKKRLTKYTLLIVNLILLIFSIHSTAFFSTHGIRMDYNLFRIFIGSYFSWLLYFFICVWVMIIVFSIYGLWTTFMEKPKSLKMLQTLLFIAFTINVIVSTPIVTSLFEAPKEVNLKLNKFMEIYQTDDFVRFKVNTIQHDYNCCGFMEPSDWSRYFKVNSTFSPRLINNYCENQIGCYYPLNLAIYQANLHILMSSSCLSLLLLFGFMLTSSLKQFIMKSSNLVIPCVNFNDAAIISDGKSVISGSDRPPYDYLLREQDFSYVLNDRAKY